MIRLEGKIFKANLVLRNAVCEQEKTGNGFVKDLEKCFINLCRELAVPIPLWLEKNTKEFARFRQTLFFEEQFTDNINFERFQIKLLKE